MAQIITGPTRLTKTTASLLDVCYTDINHISLSGTLKVHSASDHLPIYLIKKKVKIVEEKTSFIGRDYTQLGTDIFKEFLLSMPLDRILSEPNPEQSLDIYFSYITNITEKFCPQKNFIISRKRQPHITTEIIQLSKTREKLYKKAYKSKSDNDWERAVQARSEANIGIRKSKRKYIIDQIRAAKGDNIKFWNVMQQLLPTDRDNSINSVFTNNDNTLVRGKEAANEINRYFCRISLELDAKLPKHTNSIIYPEYIHHYR